MNEFTSFVILNYFSSSVVQNPTCSMGLLMCSCVLAFACPLFFGIEYESIGTTFRTSSLLYFEVPQNEG